MCSGFSRVHSDHTLFGLISQSVGYRLSGCYTCNTVLHGPTGIESSIQYNRISEMSYKYYCYNSFFNKNMICGFRKIINTDPEHTLQNRQETSSAFVV